MSNSTTARRHWLLLGFGGYCLFLAAGCWLMDDSRNAPVNPDTGSTSVDSQTTLSTSVSRNRELVDGWPQPQVAFVLTGEQQGYLEPCGCSETQSGGISRRADLFRQLREDKQWTVIGLELGDTMKRSRQQDRIKFGVLHNALTEMGYKAMGLGVSDLKLEVDFLFSTVPNSTDPETALPFVSSNVVFYDTPDIGSPARYRIIEENGLKIGVTGFLGEQYARNIFPEGNNSANTLLRVDPAIDSLRPVIEELKAAQCDLLVLLAEAPRAETEAVIKALPDFDFCLAGGGPEDPSGVITKLGKTLLLETGRKGKYAGVVGYYPDDSDQKFRFELVDLDKTRFQRTPAMESQMAFYQELLREQNVVESEPSVPHSSGNEFVGSAKCGECHTKAYALWKTTKHSHATETLVNGGGHYPEAEWINRVHDPECLACHTVGWNPQEVFRYHSGFISLEKTPQLTGQGCENCHGPGSHHTQLELTFRENRQNTPEIQAARNIMKVDLIRAEREVCRKCHDAENSPKFDFATYWQKVVHHGKD